MKKKWTLVLALCACFACCAAFAACETEESSSSTPPVSSSPADSGPDTPAPETPVMPLTEEQWKALFTLENVTVNQYIVMEGQKVPVTSILFNGADCAVIIDGTTTTLSGYAYMYRQMFDLSDEYENVEYRNGQYYVASHKPFDDDETEYSDLYVTVTDGVMTSVTGKMTDTYEGVATTNDVYIEFVNYGSTVIEVNQLPITEAQWRAAFDASWFDNITTTAEFMLGEDACVETISYANDMEKIVVDFPSSTDVVVVAELYNIDGVWYKYMLADQTYGEVDFSTEEGAQFMQYTNISSMIKSFIGQGAEMYAFMSYDEETEEYYYVADTVELRFTIVEGVLTGYKTIITMDNGDGTTYDSEYTYTFSGWGTTSFEVPFELPESTPEQTE